MPAYHPSQFGEVGGPILEVMLAEQTKSRNLPFSLTVEEITARCGGGSDAHRLATTREWIGRLLGAGVITLVSAGRHGAGDTYLVQS